MTDRDHSTIWIEYLDPPHVRLMCYHYSWQNLTHIQRRAAKMARLYSKGWHCRYCGELMPEWKRTDATYCKEGCRKMAARARRLP